MKIGNKVKIYIYRYGHKKYFGRGTYLGTEKIWQKQPHGLIIEKLKKFKVNRAIIFDSICKWEKNQ